MMAAPEFKFKRADIESDFSILFATLIASIGMLTGFPVIQWSMRHPNEVTAIFISIGLLKFAPTVVQADFGRTPESRPLLAESLSYICIFRI